MGRVNNSGASTDGRRKASPGKKQVRKPKVAVDRAAKSIVRRSARNGRGRGRAFHVKPPPERKVVRVFDLDPFEKCGRGTSVQRLIRVDEMIDQSREAHLVFLDRHGWYCEHGRTCPAVGHARRHAEQRARSH